MIILFAKVEVSFVYFSKNLMIFVNHIQEMLKQIRDSSKPHPPGIKIVEKSDVKVQGHNKLNGLSRNDLQSSGPTAVHVSDWICFSCFIIIIHVKFGFYFCFC